MAEEYVLDSVVRQALQETKLGEFSRAIPNLQTVERGGLSSLFRGIESVYAEDDPLSLISPWGVNARITYTLGDKLFVAAFCKEEFGMPRGKYVGLITAKDRERADARRYGIQEQTDKKYQRELAVLERKNEGKKSPSFLRDITMPMIGGIPLDYGQKYGILVDSHSDKKLYTARVETIIIQYIHHDAIMNIELHEETTEMTREQLLKAMDILKERYTVETGYLKGIEQRNWNYPELIDPEPLDAGPKPIHEQDNVFQRVLTGATSVDDIVTAVKSVYDAGEAFKAGIYSLREQKSLKEEEARATVLRAFG